MNLGFAIKTTRQQKGLRQNALADLCQITPAYLSQIEGNLKEPNLSTLRVISQQLGLPMPVLFFLAIDENDVQVEKREAFKLIQQPVQALIGQFFLPRIAN